MLKRSGRDDVPIKSDDPVDYGQILAVVDSHCMSQSREVLHAFELKTHAMMVFGVVAPHEHASWIARDAPPTGPMRGVPNDAMRSAISDTSASYE
jgi:hypothetical protein